MDIHRCRFVPYQPQPINALAFSHSSNPKRKAPNDLRLALGRGNGDIEIWNPVAGKWVQERIFKGGKDRTIEQLVWTQDLLVDDNDSGNDNSVQDDDLRLFSIGGSLSITEWDLKTGQQKRQAEGTSTDVWCFAAQPQWKKGGKDFKMSDVADSPCQLLAAGCEDGSIVLFTTVDNDLQFLRVLSPPPVKRTKVISITWRDRNTVVAGYEDSMIRIVDVSKRVVLRTMSLGKSTDNGRPVVWTLKCLPDGTILSGDSSGELKIWDPKNFSLMQRLKTHEADILDIAANANGDTVFTTGVDRRVVAYKRLPLQTTRGTERWQKTVHRRFHQHDVKALVSFESKELSVMVSGGIDTVPIVLPLRNWDTEYHRSLPHLPQKSQMSCSSRARLMLTWWDRDLFIWHLPRRANMEDAEFVMTSEGSHQLLARLQLKGDENITSAQLSEDGRLIVAATAAGVKLFQVRKRIELGEIEVRTRPIELPTGVRSFGAHSVGFSPDTKWLYVVRSSNIVAIVKVVAGESSKDKPQIHPQIIKLSRRLRKYGHTQSSKLRDYPQTINCVTFSTDSRALAVGDLSGAINIWLLQGHEDLQDVDASESEESGESDSDSDSDDETDSRVIHGQKWIRNNPDSSLPQLESGILALTFKPQPQHSLQSSDPPLGLHATRHNPHPISHELPNSNSTLVVITASHQITEFDVFSGRLSDWSRRNPSSYLPQSFTQIKDRTMGVFWDSHPSQRERLWLYGPTWLFMLDMTRDLLAVDAQDKIGQIGKYDVREPLPATALKRANDQSPQQVKKKRKRNTGAGDEMLLNEADMKPVVSSKSNKFESDTGLASPVSNDAESDKVDSDMEMDDHDPLADLRRTANGSQSETQNKKQEQGDTTNQSSSNHDTGIDSDLVNNNQSPIHHTIFRYRSIFGIAALTTTPPPPPPPSPQQDTKPQTSPTLDQNQDQNLEIVLVERPLYDIDLVPRFSGGQDWYT